MLQRIKKSMDIIDEMLTSLLELRWKDLRVFSQLGDL